MTRAQRIGFTHSIISAFAQLLIKLLIDPHSLMLYSRVLTNSLSVLSPYTSDTRDSRPTKICAAVTPQSTTGVRLKTVSVPTGSLRHFTLQAGKRDRQCCLMLSEKRPRAY
jgi:hypothetical protein